MKKDVFLYPSFSCLFQNRLLMSYKADFNRYSGEKDKKTNRPIYRPSLYIRVFLSFCLFGLHKQKTRWIMAKSIIRNVFTKSDELAKFYRETLSDYRINFVERRKGGTFIFRPTRVHKKRFHNTMVQARAMMLSKNMGVVDNAE